MLLKIFFIFLTIHAHTKQLVDDLNTRDSSQVEVRAVFINCHIDRVESGEFECIVKLNHVNLKLIHWKEKHLQYDGDMLRFQREELFKHNALRDCKKKLALTVKMTSDSGHSSSDEYIPIEHVFDGSNNKRVRLLNPYVLRLRREPPSETYKLHKLDTFIGLLTSSTEKGGEVTNRLRRNIRLEETKDSIVPKHNKDETDNVRCPRLKPVYNSNTQRKKRYDFDRKIENPFEENIQERGSYDNDRSAQNYNANKLNFNRPWNIHLEGKNISESVPSSNVIDHLEGTEEKFHLYEVGDPHILFKAQVQLLEKMSTPEGKTLWKDLTKQESPRITSFSPEWTNQDVNVRYRCAKWVPKEDFTLPSNGICLLLPENTKLNDGFSIDKLGDFIIVPFEDIEAVKESSFLKTNSENSSNKNISGLEGERHRRLLVRLSRAIFGRNEDNFIITFEETGKYLKMPYRQPHHAQIEIEAKADGNQLVYVGSSGRLTMAVSESTRRTRAVLTVQVTNTGLAAARLRPKIRECTPEVLRFDEDEILVKPILIPPMHTHKFYFEIPLEMPGDIGHCSVVLLNDGDDSIAVRDVRIKRGDRCFCVWHCQCVCLNEDPKLLCQEMAEYQQVAAGLTPRDRPRQVRAACYPDVVTTNLVVIALGVLLLLFILGLIKACLGLLFHSVGTWGIEQLLQTPRNLDHYYERSLRCRPVVFDEDGWPVHPDTMKRTVRLISKSMEFTLNIIFFVTMPCLMLRNSLKLFVSRCQNKENRACCDSKPKNCCSLQNIQGNVGNETGTRWRRRRRHLTRWMSPAAQQLSTDIWRGGLAPQGCGSPECMRPLLREDRFRGNKMYNLHSPIVDSEQDDTEYVLMQMQNSRETLAKHLPGKSSLVMD